MLTTANELEETSAMSQMLASHPEMQHHQDMHRAALAPAVIVIALLAGCTNAPAPGDETLPPTSAATSTSSPATPAEVTVTEANIYELCLHAIRASGFLAPGEPTNVRFAAQSTATTLTRDDGYVGVYFTVQDGNNANVETSGVTCIGRGPAAAPDWDRYGVGYAIETDDEIQHTLRLVLQE